MVLVQHKFPKWSSAKFQMGIAKKKNRIVRRHPFSYFLVFYLFFYLIFRSICEDSSHAEWQAIEEEKDHY